MIKDRNTTVLATDYQSTEQLKKFFKHCTGAKLKKNGITDTISIISGLLAGKESKHK